MARIAHEYESAVRTIPFIHVSKCIAVVAVIDPTKSRKYVVLIRVDEFAHICGFHCISDALTYQSGAHCVALDFSVQE